MRNPSRWDRAQGRVLMRGVQPERYAPKPKRVQLRQSKGWRMPPNTVLVARPSRWGNPHRVGYCLVCGVYHTKAEAVREFAAEVVGNLWSLSNYLGPLRGKDLACWCKLDEPCHADILLSLANGMTQDEVRNENLKSEGMAP